MFCAQMPFPPKIRGITLQCCCPCTFPKYFLEIKWIIFSHVMVLTKKHSKMCACTLYEFHTLFLKNSFVSEEAAAAIQISVFRERMCDRSRLVFSRAAKRGGFKRGVSRSGLVLLFLSFFFFLLGDFPDFPGFFLICLGTLQGFSRFVLFLFLGLLTAPTRKSPERVRDTIWTFPEKSGKPPGLASLKFCDPVCDRSCMVRK